MSLHVIAKIKEGKIITAYRVLDSKKKCSGKKYFCNDIEVRTMRKLFAEQKSWAKVWSVEERDEICGISYQSGRKAFRTPDGMPIIKNGIIDNKSTLMEIKPNVFVDCDGFVRTPTAQDRTISVMTSIKSQERRIENLSKCTERKKRETQERAVDKNYMDEPLVPIQKDIIKKLSELIQSTEDKCKVLSEFDKYLIELGKKGCYCGAELEYLKTRGLIEIEYSVRNEKRYFIKANVTKKGEEMLRGSR